MTRRCAALVDQSSWRDLRQLEVAVPGVGWRDEDEALPAPELLVACGLWASRESSASAVLRRRAESGAASLLVARFEPADFGPVLGAPVAILVVPAEASAVTWKDGR